MRTSPSSPLAVSAQLPQTYALPSGLFCRRLFSWVLGVSLPFLLFFQSVRADELRAIDLRIEIDPALYTSELCHKLVRLHTARDLAPWGLIFAKPSNFCTFPDSIGKGHLPSMWRLVLSGSVEGLMFAYCRPTRRIPSYSETCPWTIAIKKPEHWRELLKDDDFLLMMLAALQEQLPVRDFNVRGESLARPEPRIRFDALESPPRLARTRLGFDKPTWQIQLFPWIPSAIENGDDGKTANWWYPADGTAARRGFIEQLFEERGYSFLAPEHIAALRRPLPLPVVEIPPEPQEGTSGVGDSSLAVGLGKSVGPSGIQNSNSAAMAFWEGLWTGQILLGGLPVSAKWTNRVPSLLFASAQARHHFLGKLKAGVLAEISSEKETANVLVNTSLKDETQMAESHRLVSLVGASLQLPLSCQSFRCRLGTAIGWAHTSTRWSYDRELTTLAVWAPSGQGLFIEPEWELFSMRPNLDGLKSRLSLRHQFLDEGHSTLLSVEAGWQFRAQWMQAEWGALHLAGLSTAIGFRAGRIEKTRNIRSDATGTTVPINAFWMSLAADLEETE